MAHRTINGMQARRLATFGLTAGIVLSVSAVSLWALQIPGMDRLPEKPAAQAPAAALQTTAQKAPVAKVDAETVSDMATRLDLAVIHAEVKKEPVIETHEPTPEGPEWAYLGPIHESDRTLALISVEGQQKILSEGKSFGDTKLVSVTDDQISVEVKGAPKTIERGKRDSTKSVAWVRNMQNSAPPPGVGQPVVPGAPQPGARGALPPEVQARLSQRGMSPEQIQNFRQGREGRGGPGDRSGNGRTRGGFNNGGGNEGRQRAIPVPAAPNGDAAAADDVVIRRPNN